jgi:collagenase-like PrtC family protease
MPKGSAMGSKPKLAVGYQLPDLERFADLVATFRPAIGEVYFPWLGVPGGRGISIATQAAQDEMESELTAIHHLGVRLNLLWNATCYGGRAISVAMEQQVLAAVRRLRDRLGVDAVTTTSLFVAAVLQEHVPEIEVRASVNMGIGTVSGMRYVRNYFDGFYVQREWTRFPERLRPLRHWCDQHSKQLYLLANSGCLKNCSAHAFHDNLVAHEHELGQQETRWPGFRGICWEHYADAGNPVSLLADSTWVRPEDIGRYVDLVDGIKLATRQHRDPAKVIAAYAEGRFDGNILSLCEPDFSVLAYLENRRFPHDWAERFARLPEDELEAYCQEVVEHVNV